jgi:hypothetical protein
LGIGAITLESAGEEGREAKEKGTPLAFTPYGREGVPAS